MKEYTFKIDISKMTTKETSKTTDKRNCLNCKFLYLYIIDGKLIAACRAFEPAPRLRKFGYCGFWERKTIKLLLTNRCRDTKGRGEDCNTCANALLSRPFIGCNLKVKDFTLQDEVFCCPYYEFKSIIEEE